MNFLNIVYANGDKNINSVIYNSELFKYDREQKKKKF